MNHNLQGNKWEVDNTILCVKIVSCNKIRAILMISILRQIVMALLNSL